jgi:hypothetical protein
MNKSGKSMINNMTPKASAPLQPGKRYEEEKTEGWERIHAQVPVRKMLNKKLLGDSNNPTAGVSTGSKASHSRSSSQEGDGDRWGASLTEMSTWIHHAVSNLEPITTKLPVRPESDRPNFQNPKPRKAERPTSRPERKSLFKISMEEGKPKAEFKWPSSLNPRIGLGKKLPPGSRLRVAKAGKTFRVVHYIEKDGPAPLGLVRPLSSPDKAITPGADCNEISALVPPSRLSPAKLQDNSGRKMPLCKAKAAWDSNVPASMPSRLRKIVQEPKRFVYAWPKGATVPVKVRVKPMGRLTNQEKVRRYRLANPPTEEEWEKISSNVPNEGDGDVVMSPEVFKNEVPGSAAATGRPNEKG